MQEEDRILACVDRSHYADTVTDAAAWAARRMAAPLELLHILDRHPEIATGNDHSGAIGFNAQQHLLETLSAVWGRIVLVACAVLFIVEIDVIPSLAADLKANLIVMGTVGRGGVPGLLIGNTAETILNRCDCRRADNQAAELRESGRGRRLMEVDALETRAASRFLGVSSLPGEAPFPRAPGIPGDPHNIRKEVCLVLMKSSHQIHNMR